MSEMKVTTVQVTEETLEAIKEIAKSEDRSVSAQIRVFLADAVADYPTPTPTPEAEQ